MSEECTLSDDELVSKAQMVIRNLCRNDAELWSEDGSIPFRQGSDHLLIELIIRYKAKIKAEQGYLKQINTTLEVLIYRINDLQQKDISRRSALELILKRATSSETPEERLKNITALVEIDLKYLPISKYEHPKN